MEKATAGKVYICGAGERVTEEERLFSGRCKVSGSTLRRECVAKRVMSHSEKAARFTYKGMNSVSVKDVLAVTGRTGNVGKKGNLSLSRGRDGDATGTRIARAPPQGYSLRLLLKQSHVRT
jgi:hypothetical protein